MLGNLLLFCFALYNHAMNRFVDNSNFRNKNKKLLFNLFAKQFLQGVYFVILLNKKKYL